jgi:outer membrane lipoprotein SlyB
MANHNNKRKNPIRIEPGIVGLQAVRGAARKRGHENRTAGAAVGGLLGGALGSFAGPLGAMIGAGIGGLIGSTVGEGRDT